MSELGPEARSLLDAGRDGDDPTADDRARLRASVTRAIAAAGALGVAGTAAEATAAVKTAGSLSLAWKALGLLGICVLSAATTVGVMDARTPSPSPVATAPLPPPLPPAPAPSAAPPPSATSVAAAPPPRVVAPPPEHRPEPVSPPSAAPPLELPPSAAPTPDTLAAETQRLREAHGALRGGDPRRALALLDEPSAPGAQLREERSAARILALCDLGRVDEARGLATSFLEKNPRSLQADRIRKSCAAR